MFEDLFKKKKEEKKTETKKEPKIFNFPAALGGGQYSDATSSRSYAGLPAQKGSERDHISPLFLGGTSNRENIEYKKNDERGRQSGKASVELQVYRDYKEGKLTLNQARAKVAHEQQKIQGLIPKQGTKAYLKEGVIDAVNKVGGFFGNIFKNTLDLKNGYIPKIQEALRSTEADFDEANLKRLKAGEPAISKYGEMATMIDGKIQTIDVTGFVGNLKKVGSKLAKEAGEEVLPKIIKNTIDNIDDDFATVVLSTKDKSIAKQVIEPLVEEAKKYKSADEFVKKQKTLFHGSDQRNIDAMNKNGVRILSPEEKLKLPSTGGGNVGISMTTDAETARNYSGAFGNKNIGEFYINPNAKVKKISTYIDDTYTPAQLEKLQKEGYDLITSTAEESEVRILSDNAVKTKSQLTEIWKKANSSTLDPLIQEAKKYKSADEFVGSQKGRFHGTSIEIKKLASDEELYSPQNIYGQGFYTTDRHAIAEGYSRKGGGETPTIYNVKEKAKVPVYNIEQKMDDSLLKEINAKVNEGDAYTKDYTLRDVYDDIRELSQAGEISSDTAQNYFNTIKEILQKKGFRGIEHTGGKLTGKAEHNVKIYWNPAEDLAYSKYSTKSQLTDIWKKANSNTDNILESLITDQAGKIEAPEILQKAAFSLDPISYQERPVRSAFDNWTKKILEGAEEANTVAKKIPVVDDAMDTIHKFEAGEKTPLTDTIKKEFDELYTKAQNEGLSLGYRQNYIPHAYQETTEQVKTAFSKYMQDLGVSPEVVKNYIEGIGDLPPNIVTRLKLNPFFTKARSFPDYKTAMKYGLTPKFQEPGQLLAHYKDEMTKAIANRDFVNDLVKSKKLVTVEHAGQDFLPVNLNFMPKGYYAEPKLANMLNGIFRDEESLGTVSTAIKGIGNLSKAMQEVVLSAGVPKTDINFFSIGVGLVKELTAGNFKAAVNFVRANFDDASKAYFAKNSDYLVKMAREGVDIGTHADSFQKINEKLGNVKGLGKKIGFVWDKSFQSKTFNNLLPMNYLDTFKGVYDKAVKNGMGEEAAQKLAGDTVKAYHGLLDDVGRGKGTKDALSAIFFAPRFREGLIRTLTNTARSLTTELKNPAFAKNRQLALGMAVTYAGYNALQMKLTGKTMLDNPEGHEFELMVPTDGDEILYVPFMPSFLAFPRNMASGAIALAKGDLSTATQKTGSLLSMPLKLASELWANKDYFGREIYDKAASADEVIKDIAGYVFGINEKGASGGINHPFVREMYNQIFTDKPIHQSITEALELPVKYGSKEKIADQEFYRALEKKAKEEKEIKEKFRPVYDTIQELIESGQVNEAQQAVDELTDDEYKLYKSLQRADTTAENRKLEAQVLERYNLINELRDTDPDSASQILDAMNEEEYQAYLRLKKKLNK